MALTTITIERNGEEREVEVYGEPCAVYEMFEDVFCDDAVLTEAEQEQARQALSDYQARYGARDEADRAADSRSEW